MKCTRMKNDDPDYRASDDSDDIDDRNDNDTNYTPEDDSSIVADNKSEDNLSCPKKISGKSEEKKLSSLLKRNQSSSFVKNHRTCTDKRSTFDPPRFVSDVKHRQMARKFEVVARKVEEFQTATTWKNPIDQQQKLEFLSNLGLLEG